MMTQRMVVGPTSKAAAMDGNAILREPSSPAARCTESWDDPAHGDATMGRFVFRRAPHRWHHDCPKGDRPMRQLWMLASLAGLLLVVATPGAAEVLPLGTLKAIDPKDSAAVTVECEK